MRHFWVARLFLAFFLLLPRPSLADELEWTHYGPRPLAMGNAFVAVADDYNALFYNPAGLGRLKEWTGEFLNLGLKLSTNTMTAVKDASELASGSSGDTDKVLDFLEKNTGKTHYMGLSWTPYLIFQGFGLGLGVDLMNRFVVHREISTEITAGPRAILPITFATNFLDNRLSVGASLKAIVQGGVDREFSINDIQALTKSSNDETSTGPKLKDYVEGGIGVGTDIGILFTPIKTMRPTLGISITDFGGTPFTESDIAGEALSAPRTRLPSVNTGISLVPWEVGRMYLLCAADAHAINQPIHYSKKVNFGAEWGFGSILKVQSGLHQGELSGGFQLDVMLLKLRFVSYAEQLGAIAGQDDNLKDRRYELQLKLLI